MSDNKTRFVVRTRQSIKKEFKKIAKKRGLSMSKMINIYITEVINEERKLVL